MLRMSMRNLAVATSLGLIALAAAPAEAAQSDQATDQAIRDVLGDPQVYKAAIRKFQAAVKAGDAAAVAAMVDYPIRVSINGKQRMIANAKDFVANYAAIVTPAIAAAVQDERYADMMANAQGIMLGNGEVWINGICRDKQCKAFDARVVTIQSGPNDAPAAGAAPSAPAKPAAPPQTSANKTKPAAAVAAQQEAGRLKVFKDWAVGCDNVRSCIAIGMGPDPEAMGAYVKLSRSGEAEASVSVEFVTWPEDQDITVDKPVVRLSLDAHKAGGVPDAALPAESDGDYVRVSLTADQVTAFLAALRSATRVTVELLDGTRSVGKQQVSLAGSAAALLYMDDEQKRIGTVTALAKPGNAAASTIPPLPPLPVVKALKIDDISDLPETPKGVAEPSKDDCGEGQDPYIAFDLGEGGALWGACAFAGAYNVSYRFSIVDKDGARPASFVVPGVKPEAESDIVGNPYVEEDDMSLGSFNKGRGLGDCGDASDWAFDGKDFQPLSYSYMDACRGVSQEDWPVLYRAKAE